MKVLLAITAVFALTASAAHAFCGAEESVLREIKLKAWPSYYRNQDVTGLGAFLLEDFRVIGVDGAVSSRAETLEWLAKNRWDPKDFSYSISSITCPNSTTAIIVGEGRSKRKQHDTWFEHRYVSSNVLVQMKGRWRAALSHISGERSVPID